MGKKKRQWQDVAYVLGFFGKTVGEARKRYVSYVKDGIPLGRWPELLGGGLIRSLGGWEAVKTMRLSGQDRIKSDQRIGGGSDFVSDVLSESEGHFPGNINSKAWAMILKELLTGSPYYSRWKRNTEPEEGGRRTGSWPGIYSAIGL